MGSINRHRNLFHVVFCCFPLSLLRFFFSPEALIIWFCALNMFQNQIHHNFVFGWNNFISVGTFFLPLEIWYIYLVSLSILFKRLLTQHHEWKFLNSFSGKSQWFNNVMWFTLLSQNAIHQFVFLSFSTRYLAQSFLLAVFSSEIKRHVFATYFCDFIRFDTIATFFSFFSLYFFFLRNLSSISVRAISLMGSLIHVGCVIRTLFNCWKHTRTKQRFT